MIGNSVLKPVKKLQKSISNELISKPRKELYSMNSTTYKIPSVEKLQDLIDAKFDKDLSQKEIETICHREMHQIAQSLEEVLEEYLYFQGISPQILNKVVSSKIQCDVLAHFLKENSEFLEELNMVLADLTFLSEQPIKLQKLTRTIPFDLLDKQRDISKESSVSWITQAQNTLNEILGFSKIGLDFITIENDLEIHSVLSLTQEKAQQQLDLISTYLANHKTELDALSDTDKETKYKAFLESIDANFFPNHTEDFQEFLESVWTSGLDDVLTKIIQDMKLFEIRKHQLEQSKEAEKDVPPQIMAIFDRLKAPILCKRIELLGEMVQDIKSYHQDFEPTLCSSIENKIEEFKSQLV